MMSLIEIIKKGQMCLGALFFLASMLLPPPVYGAWPMFHGDSQSSGLSDVSGPRDPVVKWRFKGEGGIYMFHSPVVGEDGTVYAIRGTEFLTEKGTDTVYAVTPDGKEKWRYSDPERYFTPLALSGDGKVCSVTTTQRDKRGREPHRSDLICLSSLTGELLWEKRLSSLNSEYFISHVTFGPSGRIYTKASDALFVFNADGEKLWSYRFFFSPKVRPSVIFTGPVLSPDEETVYLLKRIGDEGLYAFDAETGKVIWQEKIKDFFTDFHPPTVGPDGTIYMASSNTNTVYAISPDGEKKWETKLEGRYLGTTTPTIGGKGVLYIDVDGIKDEGGAIIALNTSDGKVIWTYPLPTGGFVASAMAVDDGGDIYYGHGSGTIFSLSSEGKLNWKKFIGRKDGGSDQIYYSGVSLGNGGLYIVVGHPKREGELVFIGDR